MGVKLEDGKVTITASYGVTVNRGDFNSEKLSEGISIEFQVDGDSSAIIATAQAQQDVLVNAVKAAVLAHAGVDASFDDDGNLVPGFKAAAAPSMPTPTPASTGRPYSGQAGAGQFKPKADISGNPRFIADLGDGRGPTNWIDLRPTKAAGEFSPNAADFRDVNDSKHQVWLKGKDGAVKASVAEGLQAAGVAV